MNRRIFFLGLVLVLSFTFKGYSQSHKIDSLKHLLKQEKVDTSRFQLTIQICIEYNHAGNYAEGLDYGNQSLNIATKLQASTNPTIVLFGKKAEGRSYINIGNAYDSKADFPQARIYYLKGLKIRQEIGDKKAIADAYNNLGLTYEGESDYPGAIDYFFKGLSIYTAINYKKGMALAYSNIGVIYLDQENDIEAIKCYTRSKQIRDSIGDKNGVADCYNNITYIYVHEKKYLEAFDYLLKSIKIREEAGRLDELVSSYNNIGDLYYNLTDVKDSVKNRFINTYYSKTRPKPILKNINILLLDSAWSMRQRALALATKMGDKYNEQYALKGIGKILTKRGKYLKTLPYYQMAVLLAKQIDSKIDEQEALKDIAESYENLHKYDSALHYYQLGQAIKDSIFNEEKQKDIGKQEAKFDYEKKQAIADANSKKQLELEEEKRKRQSVIIYAAGSVLLLLAIFTLLIIKRLQVTRKQKSIIENQKGRLDEAFFELENAKRSVEEKHKDLTDSIHYASRIQTALLTTDHYLDQHLKEYFIFFKPRDIVSGDFYWALSHKGTFYLACCDCTGHGVPGAFMSLLNITFLHQTVIEKGITQPNKIFGNIRTNLIEALNQDGSDSTKDGMDAVLCSINFEKHLLSAACANNPLWIIRNGELIEFKPDKIPIGEGDETKEFTLHETSLHKGDCIYMFSDGYADQFGGKDGKKYKRAQLKELLLSVHLKPMIEQKKIIEETFNKWKNVLDQVDDICAIGLRV